MTDYRKDCPETIQAMFNTIAKQYDRNNALISLGLHRYWNQALINQMIRRDIKHTLLDLCAGTGDIAFNYLRQMRQPCQVYLVDFAASMLMYAKQKAATFSLQSHSLNYLEADVQCLPIPNSSIDCATMAYGIRNVQDPGKCLQEVFRVLKPGGCVGILELTRPHHRLLRMGHTLYLRTVLPLFGKAYQYLQSSIGTFVDPHQLEILLHQTGFSSTQHLCLAGGIATILIAHKDHDHTQQSNS